MLKSPSLRSSLRRSLVLLAYLPVASIACRGEAEEAPTDLAAISEATTSELVAHDPFAPDSCTGPLMSLAELSNLTKNGTVPFPRATSFERRRQCNGALGCGEWGAPLPATVTSGPAYGGSSPEGEVGVQLHAHSPNAGEPAEVHFKAGYKTNNPWNLGSGMRTSIEASLSVEWSESGEASITDARGSYAWDFVSGSGSVGLYQFPAVANLTDHCMRIRGTYVEDAYPQHIEHEYVILARY